MEMRYVYIVTYGEYDDYSISSVFEDENDAQAFCSSKNGTRSDPNYRVEKWGIEPYGTRPVTVFVRCGKLSDTSDRATSSVMLPSEIELGVKTWTYGPSDKDTKIEVSGLSLEEVNDLFDQTVEQLKTN